MMGDALAFLDLTPHGDLDVPGEPYADVGVVTVAADGELRGGARVPVFDTCCNWAVAPDGVAYGISQVSGFAEGTKEAFEVTALGPGGVPGGWPVSLDGMASGPAFRPDGRVVVTVGSVVRETSHVLIFDPGGKAPLARSPVLSIATAESGLDCVSDMVPPLVRPDGTVIVYSWLDNSIFALDTSLHVVADWPFEPATPLERPSPFRDDEGLNCSSLAIPAVGPDNALILPLLARHEAVGGSVTAVDPNGRVRSGWPVELQRAGSEFWSIVVGSDGTVYALAIEPESGRTSSASVVAMAPDSTVLYTTTIVEP